MCPLLSTPVHSVNQCFLFGIKYLEEYQGLARLSQNGRKILVSDVQVFMCTLSPLFPHVGVDTVQ